MENNTGQYPLYELYWGRDIEDRLYIKIDATKEEVQQFITETREYIEKNGHNINDSVVFCGILTKYNIRYIVIDHMESIKISF